MAHIEFIGPPGAGKTVLHEQLIADEQFYGGVAENAFSRSLKHSSDMKSQILGHCVPSFVWDWLPVRSYRRLFLHELFTTFIHDYPTYLQLMYKAIEQVEHQPKTVLSISKRAASHYQAGVSTVKLGEIFCSDELFFMLAASIMWRQNSDSLMEAFLESVPMPTAIIYVNSPIEKCLKRQCDRGRISIKEPWVSDITLEQERLHSIHKELSNKATDRGISVIEIENNGSIKDSLVAIKTELSQCL